MTFPARARRRALPALSLALLLPFLAPCPAAAQEAAPAPAPGPSISVDSDRAGDAAIERRVRAIFGEIGAFRGITVAVSAGVVTLGGSALDAAAIGEAAGLASRVQGVVTLRNEIAEKTAVAERVAPALQRLRQRLVGAVLGLPLFGVAVAVFLAFFLGGLWVARRSFPWDRIAPNAFVADLLRQILRLVFAAVGLVVALDLLGATALLGTILGAAGIFGLAIGFAVRDTIENYLASILLSIRQPFRPNDYVRIESYEGTVVRLTSRATVLMTFDGNHVRIPNATVFKGVIVNFTKNPERRFDLRMGVDADANLQQTLELGIATLRGLDFVLREPEPSGVVEELGDSNVVLLFFAWVDQDRTDFLKARSEAIRLVKLALDAAGVGMPEPIYRLRIEERGAAAPAGSDPAASPAPTVQPPESARPADASKADVLEERIDAERARESDLLDPAAPTE